MKNKVHKPKGNIKTVLDKKYMRGFFSKKIPQSVLGGKIQKIDIQIVRNFLRLYQTLALKYVLHLNNKKKVNLRANISSVHNDPQKSYLSYSYIKDRGFTKYLPSFFAYEKKLRIFYYKEISGTTIQNLIDKQKMARLKDLVGQSALLLKKIHQIKPEGKKLPFYTKLEENKERQKEASLIEKSYKEKDQGRFRYLTKEAEKKRQKWIKHFYKRKDYRLSHGDFHPGNVIVTGQKIKVIDFSAGNFYEPTFDVARFLIQLELMLHYRFDRKIYLKLSKPLRRIFLNKYYGKVIPKVDQYKIKYFEIRHLLQILSIVAVIKIGGTTQEEAMESLYGITLKRLKKL